MRRLVVLVGAIILVETMFYAAITPLLPELAEQLDLGKQGAGVLTGAYAAGTLLGSLPAGWLAARIGVKPTMLIGLGLLTASGLVFAFADTIVLLDGARFVQGMAGSCAWAAGMTWVAATAPRERRGVALGSVMAAAVFGVQLGPVLGALASWIGQEAAFSSVVVFTALLGLWAWTMPSGAVRDDMPARPAAALRDRRMLAGMWLTGLPAAAFGVLDVLAPLRLDELGAGALALGATFFAAAGAEALVNPAVGRYSDRHGSRRLVPAGLLMSAFGVALLPLPTAVSVAGGDRRRRRGRARRAVGAGHEAAHRRGRAHRPRQRLRLRLVQPVVGGRVRDRLDRRAGRWPRRAPTPCPTRSRRRSTSSPRASPWRPCAAARRAAAAAGR